MSQPVRKDGKKDVYLFSHSQFSTHNTCPKKYKNHYVDRIRPRRMTAAALTMGSAFHAGVEALYEGRNPTHAITGIFKDAEEGAKTADQKAQLAIDRKKVLAMVKGYQTHYIAEDRQRFAKILIEEPFEITLLENATTKLCYEGYIDALGIQEDGTVVVFEHKTAAQINPDYWNRVRLDWQIKSYAHGAKSVTGKWPKSVIYTVVKKTAIRRKVAESLNMFAQRCEDEFGLHAEEKGYFNRQELLFDKKAVLAWKKGAQLKAQQIYKSLVKDGPWLEFTNSCLGWMGHGCDFMNYCCTGNINDMLYEVKDDTQYGGAMKGDKKG